MLKKAKRPSDWGQREKHPLYKLWGWHKDRNKYGMVPAWAQDFWAFAAGVGDRPEGDYTLRRHRIAEPMGPDNFFWSEKYARGSAADMNLAERAAYMREYRKRRYRNVRSTELKTAYGITLAEWEAMYAAQGGVCAICGMSEHEKSQRYSNLAVDHCHTTKKIRGLLCNACNRAIGFLKDDANRAERLVAYLKAAQG